MLRLIRLGLEPPLSQLAKTKVGGLRVGWSESGTLQGFITSPLLADNVLSHRPGEDGKNQQHHHG